MSVYGSAGPLNPLSVRVSSAEMPLKSSPSRRDTLFPLARHIEPLIDGSGLVFTSLNPDSFVKLGCGADVSSIIFGAEK
jgi:hypothetical protein